MAPNPYVPCPLHPTYRAKQKPSVACEDCWLAWFKSQGAGGRNERQLDLMKKSGTFRTRRRVVWFIYLLIRDHVPAGTASIILAEIENEIESSGKEMQDYTNGYLAQYAAWVADRLEGKKGGHK